ncbi:MAG: hypothetical protein A3F84_19895 [Candidatus Handelsmanbacteria bacterium RIFCSPLOWO2_12_FULL_64_10]|uniref:HEAT repeat domain-containing protein n=1 Tax=Handelsmanbacteria sp. (strain RIFCSPLOWO2_12_FULL_64_10) TaxID=1817868 RepID=A0A1F6CSF7_HANXR|nr:MAG: hypothetical protein A3F84_19895 [Candidatus Handelsmanbacteria bacterium RIFCSPLOWO2_12_FULL_64_10]
MADNGPVNDVAPTPEALRRIAEEATTPRSNGVSASRMIGQLVLFPLAIVGVCVAIYLLYSLLTREERTARDLLNEVRAGGSSRRWQAAYSLSAMLARPDGKGIDAALVPEVIRAFEEAKRDDPRVRRYLARLFGPLGDRRAVPALIGALEDPDDETRLFVVESLGRLRDTSSVIPLLRQAESDDPGIKKMVAYTLGLIRDGRALPTLQGMLSASDPNVRWNAALALCRFQDRSGTPVIEEMLNREFLGRVRVGDAAQGEEAMSAEQQEEAMLNAIRGVVLLKERSLTPTLRALKASDPSLKVRQAAIEALGVLEGDSGGS